MTYYKKDGYVVDAKETITYSSPINNFQKDQKKITINTVQTSMNDEYAHSTQSPLEGPKYIKKNMYTIKTKKLINKYNK